LEINRQDAKSDSDGEKGRPVPKAQGFALLKQVNLNKLINQFVAQNYKK